MSPSAVILILVLWCRKLLIAHNDRNENAVSTASATAKLRLAKEWIFNPYSIGHASLTIQPILYVSPIYCFNPYSNGLFIDGKLLYRHHFNSYSNGFVLSPLATSSSTISPLMLQSLFYWIHIFYLWHILYSERKISSCAWCFNPYSNRFELSVIFHLFSPLTSSPFMLHLTEMPVSIDFNPYSRYFQIGVTYDS